MTTVVGYAGKGEAWLAADTMTNVYDRPVPSGVKLLQVATATGGTWFLLGFAGEGAGPAVVKRCLKVQSGPDLEDNAACNAWADAIASAVTELYVEHGLMENGRLDATLLLALPGKLWTLTHHQAIRHRDGMAAIGSGEGPALGALHAFASLGHDSPRDAVRAACRIGIQLDRYSGGAVQVEHLGTPSAP